MTTARLDWDAVWIHSDTDSKEVSEQNNVEAYPYNSLRTADNSNVEINILRTYATGLSRKGYSKNWDTTFLSHKFNAKNKGKGIIPTPAGPVVRRYTPTKYNKFVMISAWHKYPGTLKRFRKKYRKNRSGWRGDIGRVEESSWRRYCQEFKPGSPKWKILRTTLASQLKKKSRKQKRFMHKVNKPTYGLLPKWEEYHVYYRGLVAAANNTRSINWMQQNMDHVYQNQKIRQLLKPIMSVQECDLLQAFNCTRGYIQSLMVCILCSDNMFRFHVQIICFCYISVIQ